MYDSERLFSLLAEWDASRKSGIDLSIVQLCRDCPELERPLAERIATLKATDWMESPDEPIDDVLSLPAPLADAVPPDISETLMIDEFETRIHSTGLMSREQVRQVRDLDRPSNCRELASSLLRRKRLTHFQVRQIVAGEGKRLQLGNYRLLDRLGSGGMGEVYKAVHQRMERTIAIKIVPKRMLDDPRVAERFQREVRAAARLNHPNVVTAYDADECDGVPFLVLEYVEGDDLAKHVRRHGPMSVERAVDCVFQAARGLEYAHLQGVIHRDIKPANLLLDLSGTIKILDMGLARLDETSERTSDQGLTHTGAVMGTADYMSPEQGIDTHCVDPRSDLYSLGCVLHFLLTGAPPYRGNSIVRKILAHRDHPIPSLCAARSDVPAHVDAVFQKLLAKDPAERFQTTRELLEALDACQVEKVEAWRTPIARAPSEVTTAPSKETAEPDPGSIPAGDPSAADWEASVRRNPSRLTLNDLQLARRSGEKHRTTNRGKAIVVGLLFAGAILAGVIVFKLKTRGGTLIIDLPEAADVTVEVDGRQVQVIDRNGRTITVEVPRGPHEKLLVRTSDGVQLQTDAEKGFEIATGGELRLTARLVRESDRSPFLPKSAPVNADDPERLAATSFLALDGQVTIAIGDGSRQFSGRDAISELPSTPFVVTQVNLGGKRSVADDSLQQLMGLKALKLLNLSETSVTDAGMAQLRSATSLEELHLSFTNVTDNGLEHLLPLVRLRILFFYGSRLTDRGMETLARFKHLQRLAMDGSASVSDQGVEALAALAELEGLGIADTRITNDCLPTLAKMPNLRAIAFDGTKVDSEGVRLLGAQGNLTFLSLRNTKVDDAGLEFLRNQRKLQSLYLGNTAVSDKVVEWLAASARDAIYNLRLEYTNVTDTGLRRLSEFKNLEELNVRGTKVTPNEIRNFQVKFPNCVVTFSEGRADRRAAVWALNLGGSVTIRVGQAKPIDVSDSGMLPKGEFDLLAIRLNGPEQLADRGLWNLYELNHVEELTLNNTGIENFGLDRIGGLIKLQRLNLARTRIVDAALERLYPLTSLRSLDLTGNSVTMDAVRRLRKRLPNCEITFRSGTNQRPADPDRTAAEWALSLGGRVTVAVGDVSSELSGRHAIPQLPEEAFSVTQIYLQTKDSTVSDDDLKRLVELNRITSLNLTNTPTSDAGLLHLLHLRQLQILAVGRYVTDQGIARLLPLQNLTDLTFYVNGQITNNGLENLSRFPRLRMVFLDGNRQITSAGLAHLVRSSNLEVISLSGTDVDDTAAQILSRMPALNKLLLRGTKITDEGLVHVAHIDRFTAVDLSKTAVTDAGLSFLARQKDLDQLYLSQTAVTDKTLEFVRGLPHLSIMHLARTTVTDGGIPQLLTLAALKQLDLRGSGVTAEGVKRLREMLPECRIEFEQ